MRRDVQMYLLQYLRSLASTGNEDSDDDDEPANTQTGEEKSQDFHNQIDEKRNKLKENDITHIINCHTGDYANRANPRPNLITLLKRREVNEPRSNTMSQQVQIAQRFLPNHNTGSIARFHSQVFCGQFSSDGSIFMSACQDQHIRLYSTDHIRYADGRHATPFKTITARDVGWSVVDCHYSPDQQYLIYSSWSPYVHLCTIDSHSKKHEALDLNPGTVRFCAFSVRFSPNSREILAGGSDYCLYMYDLEKRKRIIKIAAHDEDVNTVAFAEQDSSHIFYSGSDDSLCKVWDRRTFHSDTHTTPVGVLEGHMDGITCITSKGDGRYFISNGKDQTMKLWDIRKMKSSDNANATQTHSRNRMGWDYRYQNYRFVHRMHPADMSIMTYVGHRVLSTLIRCYFSPPMSTGQRFVYSGSYDGSIYVYDLLTGEIVRKLTGHGGVVRDVSWHPYLPMMLSSSWDNSVVHWTWRSQHAKTANTKDEDAMQDDDDEQQWEDIDEDDSDYQPLSDDE